MKTPPAFLDKPLVVHDYLVGIVISEVCHLTQVETAHQGEPALQSLGGRPQDGPGFRAAADQLAESVWASIARPVLYHVSHVLAVRDEATLAVVQMYVKAYARQSFQAARDIAAHENRLRVLDPLGAVVPPEQRVAVQQLQRRLARLLDHPEEV